METVDSLLIVGPGDGRARQRKALEAGVPGVVSLQHGRQRHRDAAGPAEDQRRGRFQQVDVDGGGPDGPDGGLRQLPPGEPGEASGGRPPGGRRAD